LNDSIRALTGNKTQTYTQLNLTAFPNLTSFFLGLDNLQQKQTEAAIQQALVNAFKNNEVITLAVGAPTNTGTKVNSKILPGPHAYTITNIDLTNPNKPEFTIQNPWNNDKKD
jgi:hypothetical protein